MIFDGKLPADLRAALRCYRCGYHYGLAELVIPPGRLYPVCADVERCTRHLVTRERDRAAVRVIRR